MKAILRTLVIDDERPARSYLRKLLEAHPRIKVIGEAATVAEAARLANKGRPDLLFIDIQMEPENGFALLPKLDYAPKLIFVTGHDRYAVRAFEVNAADYLLKPVTAERLATAIDRLGHHERPNPAPPLEGDDVILLREAGRHHAIPISRIGAIAAEGNFTRIHLADGETLFLRQTLTEWQRRLPEATFLRADRTLLFNLTYLRGITTLSRDQALAKVEGISREFEVGRAAATRLRAALRQPR